MYKDSEGYPYQPVPIPIKLISENKIIEVSCGDAHTLALTKDGKIFSFGGYYFIQKFKIRFLLLFLILRISINLLKSHRGRLWTIRTLKYIRYAKGF